MSQRKPRGCEGHVFPHAGRRASYWESGAVMNGGQRGQVLLEVLIGVSILAMVMVAILYGFQAGINGTKRVDQRSTALNLAQSQIEYIKSQVYVVYDEQGMPLEGEGYTRVGEEDLPAGFSLEDIQILVGNLGNETSPDSIQQVTVTVTYAPDDSVSLSDYNRNE